jgi:hypothetical protein
VDERRRHLCPLLGGGKLGRRGRSLALERALDFLDDGIARLDLARCEALGDQRLGFTIIGLVGGLEDVDVIIAGPLK